MDSLAVRVNSRKKAEALLSVQQHCHTMNIQLNQLSVDYHIGTKDWIALRKAQSCKQDRHLDVYKKKYMDCARRVDLRAICKSLSEVEVWKGGYLFQKEEETEGIFSSVDNIC